MTSSHPADDDAPDEIDAERSATGTLRGDPEARALVRQVTGADDEPETAHFISDIEGKKNLVIVYRQDTERLVLKIYRQDVRYTVQALKNVVPRYLTRAFTVRSLAPARVRAELAGIEGFRAAGFNTFEVVGRPRRDALVFRHVKGEHLKAILRERQDPAVARLYVERAARDLARRQAIALEHRDLRMVHPSPRVQHIWVCPDDSFIYYDFEDRVNPGLRIERALANEVECFFFYLLRLKETADAETIVLARETVGSEPMSRWHDERARRQGWRFSGSARRRRDVYPTVVETAL